MKRRSDLPFTEADLFWLFWLITVAVVGFVFFRRIFS